MLFRPAMSVASHRTRRYCHCERIPTDRIGTDGYLRRTSQSAPRRLRRSAAATAIAGRVSRTSS